MPWSKVRFAPGVTKDVTRYGSDGTWIDCNLVRFRNGYPERWAGWSRTLDSLTMEGRCRYLHRWATLDGRVYISAGTSKRFYVSTSDSYSDVTPVTNTQTLTDPFQTTNASNVVTVTDVAHGALNGDHVIFSGATAVGGLTISGEYTLTYVDNDHYTIVAASNASSSATGGGTVTTKYLLTPGTDDNTFGGGWSIGAWSEGTWSGSGGGSDKIGLWTQDNWGEDLVANVYDGGIYYWDATNPTDRMINIRDLPGADGYAPHAARLMAVSHKERILLAFGVSEEWGGTTPAPMTVRWCNQEDIYNWDESDETGTAGSLPLSHGSQFLAVQATSNEILVWSDTALYSMQFVGAPDVYVASILSTGTDITGKNASTTFGSSVFWMGRSGFYVYDGRVQSLPSPVWDYIYRDINWSQSIKIFASSNRVNNEVIWFYPSKDSMENDKYVAYDVVQQVWTFGQIARTVWLDMSFQYLPAAVDPQGRLIEHNIGNDDNSTGSPLPLNAYIESAPLELSSEGSFDKGDRFVFIRRILPDVTFLSPDGANTPRMNITIRMMDKPGGGITNSSSSQVTQTAIIPVEEFTEDCYVRLRGRSMTIRLESDALGSMWRIGNPRFDMRTDGQR